MLWQWLASAILAARQRHDKWFVIDRLHHQGTFGFALGKGQGQDSDINLAVLEQLKQANGIVFFDQQRHLRRSSEQPAHQLRQQIGADGVNHTNPQRPHQGIFARFGNILDHLRFSQHPLCLLDHPTANGGGRNFTTTTLEERHT
jgi:hypothetical protein